MDQIRGEITPKNSNNVLSKMKSLSENDKKEILEYLNGKDKNGKDIYTKTFLMQLDMTNPEAFFQELDTMALKNKQRLRNYLQDYISLTSITTEKNEIEAIKREKAKHERRAFIRVQELKKALNKREDTYIIVEHAKKRGDDGNYSLQDITNQIGKYGIDEATVKDIGINFFNNILENKVSKNPWIKKIIKQTILRKLFPNMPKGQQHVRKKQKKLSDLTLDFLKHYIYQHDSGVKDELKYEIGFLAAKYNINKYYSIEEENNESSYFSDGGIDLLIKSYQNLQQAGVDPSEQKNFLKQLNTSISNDLQIAENNSKKVYNSKAKETYMEWFSKHITTK